MQWGQDAYMIVVKKDGYGKSQNHVKIKHLDFPPHTTGQTDDMKMVR
jgi:hypothetical protein